MANPTIAKVAAAVAFLIAGTLVAGALTVWPIVSLLFALPPLFAGIAILRGHAVGAFGYALLSAAQVAGAIVIALGAAGPVAVGILPSAIFGAAIAILFFAAGRSLRAASGMHGWLSPWIALAAVAVVIPVCFQTYVLPSASMENTLMRGDKLVVLHSPKPGFGRGSLVTFRYPVDPKQTFIKRIIGVAGDRIRLVDKTVYRNGTALTEPYVIHMTSYVDAYRDNFPASAPSVRLPEPAVTMLDHDVRGGELVVPQGQYFVLGDNRDDSLDSRYFGCVPAGDIVGKPVMIYDSRDGARIRWDRLFRRL